MGIFSRFADIINSNISSLLDKAEDPEKMVRLIIQEMEDTLVEVRSTSARVLADKKELQRKIERMQGLGDDWHAKAELALEKGREDLAKAALIEKQKVSDTVATMEQDLVVVDEQIVKLKEEIGQLQEKLEDAKARQKTILMRKKTVSSRLDVKRQLDSSKFDKAMNRFDQYESRIDGIEAEVDSYDLAGKSLQDEFAALEAEDSINSELEALKKKMQKPAKAKKSSKA
ncbi:phage shock protein PspA [Paraferrimonas sedimenticola]|uniref:Phage shock protein PspA n=1 Tax=Paraferrimonas sedimenticola TaxID=375674 RepID=A0AA37RUJ9_9GAMM|nr:phage shock protein PspA [Paraferrimonas sedimenticola]GLP94837.1 phage shock protein PspA [Paraferrimonas sedimenticola]